MANNKGFAVICPSGLVAARQAALQRGEDSLGSKTEKLREKNHA
jgi:hypothetical protein